MEKIIPAANVHCSLPLDPQTTGCRTGMPPSRSHAAPSSASALGRSRRGAHGACRANGVPERVTPGLAVGQFIRSAEPKPGKWSVVDVLYDQLAELGVPVLGGLPIGHGPHPPTVPLGTMATLDTMACTLTIEPEFDNHDRNTTSRRSKVGQGSPTHVAPKSEIEGQAPATAPDTCPARRSSAGRCRESESGRSGCGRLPGRR